MRTKEISKWIREIGYRLVEAQIFSDKSEGGKQTRPAVILVNHEGKPASVSTLKSIAALIKKAYSVDVIFDIEDPTFTQGEPPQSEKEEKPAKKTPSPSAGLQAPVYQGTKSSSQSSSFLPGDLLSWHILESVFDRMSIGIFLVDKQGNVPVYNTMAAWILSENHLWSRDVEDIEAEMAQSDDDDEEEEPDEREAPAEKKEVPYLLKGHPLVRDVIKQSQAKHKTMILPPGQKDKASRYETSSFRGLDQLVVCPIRGGESSIAAAVFVYDLSYRHHDLAKAFCFYHDFSAGEAKVAAALLRTTDTKTMAGDLFLSIETVRSYIKILFDKTGINSRQKLIKILAGGAAGSLRP